MDLVANLTAGFSTALEPVNLGACVLGVTLGMVIGVLPGLGTMATVSLLLPLTWSLEPVTALIMLGGIFYGGQYGGSTASILLNLPGTAANAVTCMDGYPMAQQGRAGPALLVTTLSSFVGASVAILLLMASTPLLAAAALQFGSAEYFAVMVFALMLVATCSAGSALRGLSMVLVGMLLGTVGIDTGSGRYRFTFGSLALADGIDIVALAMGLFGVAEILSRLAQPTLAAETPSHRIGLRSLLPQREDLRRSVRPTLRGTLIGVVCGILPGTGATLASFLAYAAEKRVAADPSRFGKGAIEGVAAPEAANNAAVQAAFIPTLALGIPGDAVMAILLGAMVTHGVVPGPRMLEADPTLFQGLVASFWLGNLLLLVLNIPLIGIWVRLLSVPYRVLYPVVLFLIAVGAYSLNNRVFEIYVVMAFGLAGYAMKARGYPASPLLFGFILGPMAEEHFRRALVIGRGDLTALVATPLSLIFLLASGLLALSSLRSLRRMTM
jgi:TctA family transporter